MPPLTVVVVAYHAPKALREALLPLATRLPLVVVDNSDDDDVRAVANDLGATFLPAGGNLGFGRGVNLALEQAVPAGHDVLLLNPDAVIAADDVLALQVALHAHERRAAVSPALTGDDGTRQQVTWPFPSPREAIAVALALRRLVRSGEDFLVGAVLLLRAEALDQVGRFDPRFFLYAEEADWQRRARHHGWSVAEVPQVTARHASGGTSPSSAHKETLLAAGQETFVRKWHGASGWQAYRWATVLGAVVRALVGSSPRRSANRWRASLYRRGPVSVARELGLLPAPS